MPNLTISINARRPFGLGNSHSRGSDAGRWLLNALQSAVEGSNQSDGVMWNLNDAVAIGTAPGDASAHASPAAGALILSGGAGAVGGTIGGTLVTTAFATSDTVTCTALAAAIRTNTTVNKFVTATNYAMRVTLASVTAGQYIDIGNVRFTAVAASANITDFGMFEISGGDNADAQSLCYAIAQHPATAMRYKALSVAGLVYVFPTTDRVGQASAGKFDQITNPGSFSTFTINAAVPTVGAAVGIIASVPGVIGNFIDLAPSGTGMTDINPVSAGFLGLGSGGGTSPQFLLP